MKRFGNLNFPKKISDLTTFSNPLKTSKNEAKTILKFYLFILLQFGLDILFNFQCNNKMKFLHLLLYVLFMYIYVCVMIELELNDE